MLELLPLARSQPDRFPVSQRHLGNLSTRLPIHVKPRVQPNALAVGRSAGSRIKILDKRSTNKNASGSEILAHAFATSPASSE